MPRLEHSIGPDWTDVRGYLSAFDTLHGSTSWLQLSVIGLPDGTEWQAIITSVWPVADGRKSAPRLVTSVLWPNVNSATMEGALLKLLVDHDLRTSREVYTQTKF